MTAVFWTHVFRNPAFMLLFVLLAAGCAKAPPTLSPSGAAAFNALRVVRVLDLVRDTAIDAHAQTPPLIATEHTRAIVRWHAATLKTIAAVPDGWRATVLAGLVTLEQDLPPDVWAKIAIYVTLVRTVIQEVGT